MFLTLAFYIGKNIQSPGTPCGNGLCDSVARAMGLKEGTAVGTSIVDAHAGVIGELLMFSYIVNMMDWKQQEKK